MPERNCVGCTKQAEWGCYAKKTGRVDPLTGEPIWHKPAPLPLTVDDEERYDCPRQHLRENTGYWHTILLYYGMYKKGHLPQSGAVTDQSNKAIELFQLLDDVNAQCDAEIDAEDRRKREGPNPYRPHG